MHQLRVNTQGWHNHPCVSMWSMCVQRVTLCVCPHCEQREATCKKPCASVSTWGECVSGWTWEGQGGSTARVASSSQTEPRGRAHQAGHMGARLAMRLSSQEGGPRGGHGSVLPIGLGDPETASPSRGGGVCGYQKQVLHAPGRPLRIKGTLALTDLHHDPEGSSEQELLHGVTN